MRALPGHASESAVETVEFGLTEAIAILSRSPRRRRRCRADCRKSGCVVTKEKTRGAHSISWVIWFAWSESEMDSGGRIVLENGENWLFDPLDRFAQFKEGLEQSMPFEPQDRPSQQDGRENDKPDKRPPLEEHRIGLAHSAARGHPAALGIVSNVESPTGPHSGRFRRFSQRRAVAGIHALMQRRAWRSRKCDWPVATSDEARRAVGVKGKFPMPGLRRHAPEGFLIHLVAPARTVRNRQIPVFHDDGVASDQILSGRFVIGMVFEYEEVRSGGRKVNVDECGQRAQRVVGRYLDGGVKSFV